QVENVAAAQLGPILRPLIPQQGHLAAYPATNVLIISDRASNVDRLMRIISRIDKVSDAKIDVIPLEHAAASEVVRILNSLFQKGGVKGAASSASRVNLAADERTNSILISGERSARLRYKVLISHLDTPLSTGGNTRVVYLHYVKAKDLAPILSGVSTSIKNPKAKGQVKAQSSEVNIQADETTNALVITAPPDVFRSLQAVISQLDIRRAQVLVEAVIAEVSLDQSRALGIQWAVADGKSGTDHPGVATQFSDAAPITTSALISAVQGGSVPALKDGLNMVLGTYTKGGESIAALITALAGDGSTNILSTPSLVTLDNNTAEIIVGENVPFVTGSFTNTGGTTGTVNPFQTIERQDVGLTLKVTPQINEGDAIMLDIEQEISDVVASAAGAADLTTTKRSIKTTVMVEDGQILVLGGLIDDKVTQSEQKVPLLGDIPILGHLFKHTTTTKDKSNTMVFIKPTILRDAATNRNVTNSKYNYMRTEQIEMRNQGVALFPNDIMPVLPENINEASPDKNSGTPQKPGQIETKTAPRKSSDFDPIIESDDIFD
ncbi:MAG: type II secretion system secretin GspD, partial [Gammaproteobacteria bacterium]|nr:type II secretion system secretin GspD [Gammaproteobacteria bacterium]